MDPDLENVIRQALADAEAAGRDHVAQTEQAVRAVLQARRNMTTFGRADGGQFGTAVIAPYSQFWTEQPKRFRINPLHHTLRLNT